MIRTGDEVTISVEKYVSLVNTANELEALKCSGVDNWGGYGEHWEYYEELTEDEVK